MSIVRDALGNVALIDRVPYEPLERVKKFTLNINPTLGTAGYNDRIELAGPTQINYETYGNADGPFHFVYVASLRRPADEVTLTYRSRQGALFLPHEGVWFVNAFQISGAAATNQLVTMTAISVSNTEEARHYERLKPMIRTNGTFIASGGAASSVLSANPYREGLFIQNLGSSASGIYIALDGEVPVSATKTLLLGKGANYKEDGREKQSVSTHRIRAISDGGAHTCYVREWE